MKASPGYNPSTAETGDAAVCLGHLGGGDRRTRSTRSSSTTLPGSLGTDCLSMRCNEVQERICLLLLCSLGQCLTTSAWKQLYREWPHTHPPVRRDSRCASPCPAHTLQHCRTYVLLLELDKTIAACILKS